MSEGRRRGVFGPLLYGTLALACLVAGGLGLWRLWPSWRQSLEIRSDASELRDPSALVSGRAADKLSKAGPAAVPWLIDASRDRDARVRALAFSALGYTLPVPRATVWALIAGLRDEDPRARREAADALARIGPDAVMASGGLTEALSDRDPGVRCRAARALWRIGRKASEPVPQALLSLVADPVVASPPVRIDAVEVIRAIGGETEAQAVSALLPLISARDPAVRREAIASLERFGPRAHLAIPALERALGDDDRVARCLAALALSEIEGWEKGRARSMLRGMVDDPLLPPRMQQQVRWVTQADLVNGSEFSQPVHTLRALVVELRQVEDKGQAHLGSVVSSQAPEPE
jgi:HEAT repeat protein